MTKQTNHELPIELCRMLDQRGAEEISLSSVSTLTSYTDYIVIATGRSTTVVKALSEHVQSFAKENGLTTVGIEGLDAPDWVIIDVGEMVIHLFSPEARRYYDLDKLWLDADTIAIGAGPATS